MSLITEKVTAPSMSAATDNGKSLSHNNKASISEKESKINDEPVADECEDYFQMISSPDYLYTISLTELYDTVYKPKLKIVDNLLCSGVYLFAGAPKVGKSFFMAQLGYHVSSGVRLWEHPVNKGTVLYLALEDDYARLQKRLSRMFGMDGIDSFHFATNAKNLREGLDGQLKKFMREHPHTKLIIIDTLQRIREVGGEKYSGLLGAADGAFIMMKERRTDNKAMLDIVGRDQQDQRLYLQFDRERCVWQLTKAETQLWKEPPDPLLEAVAKFLTPETPEWVGSASDLIDRLAEVDVQPNVLTRKLNVGADRLWNEYGILIETKRIHAGRLVKLMREKLEP